jgi:AIPR protein
MADIHIQRIKSALKKLFENHIAMSDYHGRPDRDREMAFLSRALAAYPLLLSCDIDEKAAGAAITDAFDDGGIDVVYFDKENEVLYLGQSKWIDDGNGSIKQGDCQKLLNGCRDIVNLRLDKFNNRIRAKEAELRAAIENTDVRIVLILAYSGTQPLSAHVQADTSQFLAEMNDPSEVFSIKVFDQSQIYNGIASHAQRHSINLQVLLHEWGNITHPYSAFYGQVDATSVAEWWKDHGRSLFARNLRNYKGATDINNSIMATVKDQPEHFWYFNNGVTILCSRVQKQLLGGSSRESGVFECHGVNIVNGAQTVGVIGVIGESTTEPLQHAKVLVRLISLENCPDGFDKSVTRATNTQNRIDNRDFAALDPNQGRLASEFALDGRHYAYKSGDMDPAVTVGCTIADATVALACAEEIGLAVQAKREIGRLWEDIDREPYTKLFNDQTSSQDVWKAVEIMRAVDVQLNKLQDASEPRADLVAIHGNRFVLHRAFRHEAVRGFRAAKADIEALKASAQSAADQEFPRILDYLNQRFPVAYLASFFKNLNRCRELNEFLEANPIIAPTQSVNDSASTAQQKELFENDTEGLSDEPQ